MENASLQGMGPRPFRRIVEGKWLTGVVLGLATRAEFSVVWVRALTVVVCLVGAALFAPWREGDLMVMALGACVLTYLLVSLLLPPVPSVPHYERLTKRG